GQARQYYRRVEPGTQPNGSVSLLQDHRAGRLTRGFVFGCDTTHHLRTQALGRIDARSPMRWHHLLALLSTCCANPSAPRTALTATHASLQPASAASANTHPARLTAAEPASSANAEHLALPRVPTHGPLPKQ